MSKIIFVNNSEDLINDNFDVFKAKPIDRNEEGVELTKLDKEDSMLNDILLRRSLDVE